MPDRDLSFLVKLLYAEARIKPLRWCRVGNIRLRFRPLTKRKRTLRARRARNAVKFDA